MRVIFIRHGQTAGNLEKRYIGRTDESLCHEGISELAVRNYPNCDAVICSPMKRCIETAKIIYPNIEPILCSSLKECDFGDFEGKNYIELSGNEHYQAWIDSGGTMQFLNGETTQNFRNRCCEGFVQSVKLVNRSEIVAYVVHGGTIMAVLDRFSAPHMDYFDWQCENGSGFICQWNGTNLKILEKL